MNRNAKLILLLLAFLPLFAFATDDWNDALYKQIEDSVREPAFNDKTFNIEK